MPRQSLPRSRRIATAAVGAVLVVGCAAPAFCDPPRLPLLVRDHPRLYCTADDLPRLRALRTTGNHAALWRNLADSAEWCLTQQPRRAWIAPIEPDPIYENLYDRFYAIMADLAITEHLGFAYAVSGEARYGDAARRWVLASARAWQREAEGAPDGGKAYAVCRLLKGIAVGYDLAFDRLSSDERAEIRRVLAEIGHKYYEGYFITPAIAGPDFHTHHAVVEWGSFGVAALAVLGEVPQADDWLAAAVRKFDQHLLPRGLAADGAQVEGPTFWASTMHYRLFFLDALRRVTGRDLFGRHRDHMRDEPALAAVAARRGGGYDQDHAQVVLEPSYGQLDYYAPVLLALAREYRRGIDQHLALWDESLGGLQRTRYTTPHGETLLFELGGYAYVWYDPSVAATPDEPRLSYQFPSVQEAYLRRSWTAGDLLVGVRRGQTVVHAAGSPVLIDLADEDDGTLAIRACSDDGTTASLAFASPDGARTLSVRMDRAAGQVSIERTGIDRARWWCHALPARQGNSLDWRLGPQLRVTAGEITALDPIGHAPLLATGFLKLRLRDPAHRAFPLVTAGAADGRLAIQIALPPGRPDTIRP